MIGLIAIGVTGLLGVLLISPEVGTAFLAGATSAYVTERGPR